MMAPLLQRTAPPKVELKKVLRTICTDCWQPSFNCFCEKITPFDPNIEFVVLIHPIESRRRIATGRMAYLSLKNSHIIRGSEFSNCPTVNRLLADKSYNNIVLARGESSIDVTSLSDTERSNRFTSSRKLRVFVLDGTWSNAGKMMTRSPNLNALPRFCFTPVKPSNIRVRKQPSPMCYSTLEAVHHIIELLGPSQGFNIKNREHDHLLTPFNWMVEQQIERLKTQKTWRSINPN